MKNYIQEGETLDVTLGADVDSGDVIIVGDRIGVAVTDGANGETISAKFDGVFELPAAAENIAVGKAVYWSVANSNITATDTDNVLAGFLVSALTISDGVAKVKINA